MYALDSALKSFVALLDATPDTPLVFNVSYVDGNRFTNHTERVKQISGLLNGEEVDLTGSPRDEFDREVKLINVRNTSSADRIITFFTKSNDQPAGLGNTSELFKCVLKVAYTVEWTLENGWRIYNNFGSLVQSIESGGINVVKETLIPASDGQTLFSLLGSPNLLSFFELSINGNIQQHLVDYTITTNEIEWLNFEFELQTTDKLIINYSV